MNIKALVTTLVLGSSSLAMAQPAAHDAISVRDHRLARWTTLGSGMQLDHGRELIAVGADRGRFQTVMLRANSGSTFVSQVAIEFANGQTQKVRLGEQLGARNATIKLDLAGNGARAIKRIVVYGSSGRRASYSVLAG